MAKLSIESLEVRLQQAAAEFIYPSAPSISRLPHLPAMQHSVRRAATYRGFAWGAALIAVALLASLFSVPSVRAAVAEFLQIGVVRIIPAPLPEASPPPTAAAPSGAQLPVTATPGSAEHLPTPTDLSPLANLLGETTLADARRRVDYAIRLPSYPPDLGEPDRVFLQNMGGSMLVLVWTGPGAPEQARLSLHMIPPGSYALEKIEPRVVRETQVSGQPAVWAEGPYLLAVKNGDMGILRLIDGHVLIWVDGELTYRLETDLPIEEAVKVAESLR